MAFDSNLADRVRGLLSETSGFAEKKMFGGICMLLHGNMACGILNDDLIVRVGPKAYGACLEMDHARVFDITGRVMTGWVMVGPGGLGDDADLKRWVDRGRSFALTLDPK